MRAILSDPRRWRRLPEPVREWLRLQRGARALPPRDGLLVETFPRGGKWFLVAYCFEGRLAHQTLGMLVTKRMERLGCGRSAIVAHRLRAGHLVGLRAAPTSTPLFAEDILGDDLEEWMAESSMLRRTFRNIATIAGLIEKNHPGAEKSGRQMTMNSRPDLRRAAQARARPHPAARDAAGGRAAA